MIDENNDINNGVPEDQANNAESPSESPDSQEKNESESVETVSSELDPIPVPLQSQAPKPESEQDSVNVSRSVDYVGGNNNPPLSAQQIPVKPKKNIINIFTAVILCIIFVVSAFLAVYCVVSDIVNADKNIVKISENSNSSSYNINIQNKPENAEEKYIDDDGKYTTEGIAKYIRPQIVEIYVCKDGDIPIASGSGIILTEDGYIITNTHIIDAGSSYTVFTSDDRSYNADLIGRDAKTDIAVIKVSANGLPAAELGNSDEVELGEKVVAIGNPAGLSGSVSDGIVSGINRKIKTSPSGYEMNYIQTDTAISSGNSGGALVNMYGQVIGITSSKYIDYINLSYEGLGFAITINEAKPIIEELINTGYVSGRVRMGISFISGNQQETKQYFKENFDYEMPKEVENGILITEISNDCDISKTELKPNDFILSVEGASVSSYDELNDVLKDHKAGDILTADCARIEENKQVRHFTIKFKLMSDTSGDF